MQTINEVKKALSAIADGADFKIETLYNGEWVILVENDDHQPDNGSDPYLAIQLTARLA